MYKNVARTVCSRYADGLFGVTLLVQEKTALIGGGSSLSFDCDQLAAANRK